MCKLFSDYMHGRHADFIAENHELRKHEPMISKFEKLVIKQFGLTGELQEDERLNINLVAECPPSLSAGKLLDDMRSKGFEISKPEKIAGMRSMFFIHKAQIEDLQFDLQYRINY